MFVYKKGELKETPIAVSKDEIIYRLSHLKSGLNIEVKFNPEDFSLNTNPYKVYKEENGVYKIFKEFYPKNISLKENFERAIAFFEDSIFKELGETPPTMQQQPPSQPPKKVTIPPEIGDIIKVGNEYGIVLDIIDDDVIVRELTKEEALGILRTKRNAGLIRNIDIEE
jgi:hypothetical protein